jgi:hypothetical protein
LIDEFVLEKAFGGWSLLWKPAQNLPKQLKKQFLILAISRISND